MDFRIDVENGKAKLTTPYNPEFVKKIKNAGGKWNRAEKVWVVDEDNIEYAREIMNDVYGRSDLPTSDLVDVKITFEYEKGEFCAPYVIMGKVVSRAYGRKCKKLAIGGYRRQRGHPQKCTKIKGRKL